MEGVEIRHEPPEKIDEIVATLDNPWIGDEGPLDAWFRRGQGGRDLLPRGLAFDAETTVVWDEDEVCVVHCNDGDGGGEGDWIVLKSDVLIRKGFEISQVFERIDYLRDGVLVASRYRPKGGEDDA